MSSTWISEKDDALVQKQVALRSQRTLRMGDLIEIPLEDRLERKIIE